MPSKAHFAKTEDIDEQAALLRGWNQTYAQTSSGKFAGSIAEVEIDGVYLFAEETSNALYQTGALPDELCAIGVPLKFSGRATFCGAPCDGPSLHVFSGDGGFEFLTPGGLVMAGMVTTLETLEAALTEADQEAALDGFSQAHLRRTTAERSEALRHVFEGVFDYLRTNPELTANSGVSRSLRRSLVSALVTALTDHGDAKAPSVAPNRRWQIVCDARDLARQDLEKPITVAELCVELGVSRRTLQHCFHETLGTGPAEFLRAVRLNGARRALKTSPSVTEAAALWGFLHFGRFAHDYRAMFGERPSDTFRRHHPKMS